MKLSPINMHYVSMTSSGQVGGSSKQQQQHNPLGFPEHTIEHKLEHRSEHITKDKSELINHREHRSNKITINASRPTRVHNTSGSVTFKGLGGILPKAGKEAGKISDKLYKLVESKKFNNVIEYVFKNEAMFAAVMSLGLGATIKPILTIAMPGAEQKDKVSIAAKHIVSAVVGYALSWLVLKPIGVGVTKITKNPAKYLKHNQEFLDKLVSKTSKEGSKGATSYSDAFDAFWKNCADSVISPAKAALCVIFTPMVTNILNSGKNKKAQETKELEHDLVLLKDFDANKISEFNAITGGGK
ncbi:hypothetical protein IKA15_04380 [bacterium]|nr:hypothetical protein [bacterium]